MFDNVFNIEIDIKGKTSDNVKATMDLVKLCMQRQIELVEQGNKRRIKPKA